MSTFMKKWGLVFVLLLLSTFMIAGCGSQEENTKGEQNIKTDTVQEEADNEPGQKFPVTITDDANKEVTIESDPQTIVSIQASNTEIAFALGLGERIVGVSDYCNYPAEALEKEKVGGQDINVEMVLSLQPDIALVTDYHNETHPDILKQFEEAGIKVIVVGETSSFEEVYKNIEMIGKATGTEEKANKMITDMKDRLTAIKQQAAEITEKKKVWVEVSPSPDIFTTGKNTFMHEMLESIQAINAAEDQEGWVKLTEEEIVQLNPDVIITTYGYYVENPSEQVLARKGWQDVPAIKNEQVFDVDNDTVTRPGPRLIEGVETLAKLIYPEVFKK